MKVQSNACKLLELIPAPTKFTKSNSITFKLRVSPSSDKSPTFEVTLLILDGSEGIREAVTFRKVIASILTGMHATNADKKDGIVRQVLKGNAKQAYEQGIESNIVSRWLVLKREAKEASAQAGETADEQQTAYDEVDKPEKNDDDVQNGVDNVVIYMSPYKALPRIKRWLRRECRKPADMTIREFHTHISRVNNEEIPHLPPGFSEEQKLAADEMVDIILYAIPNSWKKELDRQGKDPDELGQIELVRFLEQLEAAEVHDTPKKSEPKKTVPAKKKAKMETSGKRFCRHHGWQYSHDSDGCKVLKGQEEKKPAKFGNKTWKRTKDTKQEIKALIRETVEEMNNAE